MHISFATSSVPFAILTKTAIFPSPWIYFETIPSDSNLTNLLIDKFSPIVAIFPINASCTVFPSSNSAGEANNSSTSFGFLSTTCFATFITNVLNSSFLATKSVSEFTSTTAPTFLFSDI